MKKSTAQIIVIGLILVGVLIGMTSLSRPKLIPASAPATEFSAERAMEDVTAISQAPHPPGSAEIETVRSYILAQLEAMGLSPEVQDTTSVVSRGSSAEVTSIKNIIAVIPGSKPSQAILLDAHYDTRAMTPGASDCSSCVATVLETARVILAGPALQNDVILLFTDNEEYGGGLGAAAFLSDHHLADEIGLVLNFEGLGSTGPAILFETGPHSGWAVQGWGRVASYPVGQSWFQEIYGRTPIGTDLNWFSDAGIPGMNFGHWADGPVYHAKTDTPETLDVRSLQHHGATALALVQHFGNQDLAAKQASSDNVVYFSLFPGILINYSTVWAVLLAIGTGLMLIAIALQGRKEGRLTRRGTLKGAGGFFLSILLSSGLATGIWFGTAQLHSEYTAMLTFRGMVYNAQFYFYAFIALAVFIAAVILVRQRRNNTILDLLFGAQWAWWILALATSILTPGFSYLFTWPLVFSALANFWVIGRNEDFNSALILTIGALPGIIIVAPSIYVMFHFALAPMIGILAFMAALILGLLIPTLDLLTREHPKRLIWAAALTCIGFLITGSLTAGFIADQPCPNAVAYLLNADSGEATWFSAGYLQDDWTRQFFATDPEYAAVGDLFPIEQSSGFPIMRGEAPKVDLIPPQVEILSDQTASAVRTVKLKVSSPRQAPVILLDVAPYSAVQTVTLAGTHLAPPSSERDLWSLTYYAVPLQGFEITLELDPSADINLQVSDQTWNLTPKVLDSLGTAYKSRPADMMPMPNFDYGTVVVKTLNLE